MEASGNRHSIPKEAWLGVAGALFVAGFVGTMVYRARRRTVTAELASGMQRLAKYPDLALKVRVRELFEKGTWKDWASFRNWISGADHPVARDFMQRFGSIEVTKRYFWGGRLEKFARCDVHAILAELEHATSEALVLRVSTASRTFWPRTIGMSFLIGGLGGLTGCAPLAVERIEQIMRQQARD